MFLGENILSVQSTQKNVNLTHIQFETLYENETITLLPNVLPLRKIDANRLLNEDDYLYETLPFEILKLPFRIIVSCFFSIIKSGKMWIRKQIFIAAVRLRQRRQSNKAIIDYNYKSEC